MNCQKQPALLELSAYINDCPELWIKFIKSVNPTGLTCANVDIVLRDVYRAELSNHKVTFHSHTDYMMFLMNWS
jgi:hypothetical protein